MGKAYANRSGCREGDFYPTPKSLVWVIEDILRAEIPPGTSVLEPCAGEGAISDELIKMGYRVTTNDLYQGGYDYLTAACEATVIVTNPPFSKWDDFVVKAKKEAQKVMMIGRLNYFGTMARSRSGIWDTLKAVYCFNRYVDYRTPQREDGHFHVGAMATAWFL